MTQRRPAFEVSVRVFLQRKRAQVEAETRVSADEVIGYCVTCGYSHRPEDRRRAIRRLLPATFEDIRAEWPCWYGDYGRSEDGAKRFSRDMHAMGAVYERDGIFAGLWHIPEPVLARSDNGACP